MSQAAVELGVQFVPGTMLGKYELLATIGIGGMASVILARQRGPGGFEKVVVVKLVHPHLAQDVIAINMLLDEAKVAAQIDHHNVVHTYELGQAGGTFYIAMEYLAGESLAQVIKLARAGVQPPFSPYLAARIVADAANGLHFAHELRDFNGQPLEIVHRDVSPGNIVVLYNGAVKVVDFGIARAHGRVTSTQEGELKGKYGYMSPEQIKNEPMDRRSDVFSLGVVLWEALAQRRLFQSDNVAAILMQILNAPRLPPSQFRPGVPPALDAIAVKALATDPRDRFQTAQQMQGAIEDVIWQSRYGAAEISAHMSALFADRIEQRRTLLAQVSSSSLNQRDLAAFTAAFKDPASSIEPRPVAAPSHAKPAGSGRTAALILGGAVAVGIVAGIAVGFTSDRSPTEPAVEQAAAIGRDEPEPTEPEVEELDMEAPAPRPAVTTPTVTEPPPTDAAIDAPEIVDASRTRRTRPTTTRPSRSESPPPATEPEVKPKRAGDASALYAEATRHYLAGNFDAAEDTYKRALVANRSFAAAHRGLGFLYQRTGDKRKAIESLRTYLELSPGAKDAPAVRKRLEQLGGTE